MLKTDGKIIVLDRQRVGELLTNTPAFRHGTPPRTGDADGCNLVAFGVLIVNDPHRKFDSLHPFGNRERRTHRHRVLDQVRRHVQHQPRRRRPVQNQNQIHDSGMLMNFRRVRAESDVEAVG